MIGDGSTREQRRKSPVSDQQIITAILKGLYERLRDGDESGIFVHTLCSLPGIPTQRDKRVKDILLMMQSRGYVTAVKIEERVGYKLTPEGKKFWENHGLALSIVSAMSRRTQNRY